MSYPESYQDYVDELDEQINQLKDENARLRSDNEALRLAVRAGVLDIKRMQAEIDSLKDGIMPKELCICTEGETLW